MNWNNTFALQQSSTCKTYNIHLRLRQMLSTMLLVLSSFNKDTRWPITMKHSLILSRDRPPMIRICISSCKLVDNKNIIFWGRIRSYTRVTSLFNLCRHKGSYRMSGIRNSPHTYNNSIWTSNTRRVAPIMSKNASIGPWLWHWP